MYISRRIIAEGSGVGGSLHLQAGGRDNITASFLLYTTYFPIVDFLLLMTSCNCHPWSDTVWPALRGTHVRSLDRGDARVELEGRYLILKRNRQVIGRDRKSVV